MTFHFKKVRESKAILNRLDFKSAVGTKATKLDLVLDLANRSLHAPSSSWKKNRMPRRRAWDFCAHDRVKSMKGKARFQPSSPTISNRHPKTIARFRQVLDEVWKTLAPLRDSSQSWSSQQPCAWQSPILIYINWQITETHAKHLNLNQSINSLIHPSFSIQGPLDNRFVMIKCPLSLDAQVTRCPGSLKQSTTWHVASSQASTNSAPRRASFSRTPSAVVHTKVGLQRADAFDKCKTKQTVTWPRFQRRKLATCKFTFQLAAFFRLGWSD